MRASRPTTVRVVAAPRLVAGPPLVVGEGFIPPAGTCGSAGSPGRCEHRPLQRFAIPQRVRFPGWPQALPFRRGGFHIRPRMFAPPRFPGWSLCFPPSCRAGVHARRTFLCNSKFGCCFAAGSGGMRASRPTAVRVVAASRLAAGPPLVVGEGFIPPADTCGSARSPGRCKHRPLQRFAAYAAGLSSPG